VFWYVQVFKKYASFSGRARRVEYWVFTVGNMLVVLTLLGLWQMTSWPLISTILVFYLLGSFIPNLAVMVRRLHDVGQSGWVLLLAAIPLLGALLLFVFSVLPGNPGPNRFGPDPKADPYAGVPIRPTTV
jgi:uncharacterized membrane protein YhaH (DUF805 family)